MYIRENRRSDLLVLGQQSFLDLAPHLGGHGLQAALAHKPIVLDDLVDEKLSLGRASRWSRHCVAGDAKIEVEIRGYQVESLLWLLLALLWSVEVGCLRSVVEFLSWKLVGGEVHLVAGCSGCLACCPKPDQSLFHPIPFKAPILQLAPKLVHAATVAELDQHNFPAPAQGPQHTYLGRYSAVQSTDCITCREHFLVQLQFT